MLFCNSCGGILIPKKDKKNSYLVCRQCNLKFDKGGLELTIADKNLAQDTIDVRDSSDNLPTIEVDCEKCGNNKAYWWMTQTRASDEPETRFFKCTKCSHTRREYD